MAKIKEELVSTMGRYGIYKEVGEHARWYIIKEHTVPARIVGYRLTQEEAAKLIYFHLNAE